MSEQSGRDAGDIAQEMREHEREARERDEDGRDSATGVEDPDADATTAKPAPPGTTPTGELGGGTRAEPVAESRSREPHACVGPNRLRLRPETEQKRTWLGTSL